MSLYQLKITLKWSDPAIWRRVVVSADMSLERLHVLIQWVMPWTNSHMHQFIAGKTYYGAADPASSDLGVDMINEEEYSVADLAPAAKKKFLYEYDFGDGWLHEVVVEKILPPDKAFKHPVCLAGANACPPDDCGGLPGFYHLLEILQNPKNPEYAEMEEWIGGDFDAERFDLEELNRRLKRFKT